MVDKKSSVDQNGVAFVLMLTSSALGGFAGLIGEVRLGAICLSLAVLMAITLWTSLGTYLGVRSSTATNGGYKRRRLGALVLVVLLVAGIAVCPPLTGESATTSQDQAATSPAPTRLGSTVGYLGLPGSSADLRKSQFGQDLSDGIVNFGEVDAQEVQFGVPFNEDLKSLSTPTTGPEKVGIEIIEGATGEINGGTVAANSVGIKVGPGSSVRIRRTDLKQNRVGLSNRGTLRASASIK